MSGVRTPGLPELRPIPSTGGLYLAGADGSIWRALGFDPRGHWRPARRIAERRPGSSLRGLRWGFLQTREWSRS